MTGPFLRRALITSVLVAAIALLIRTLRGEPVPAFERSQPPGAPWPTLRPESPPSVDLTSDGEPDWVGPVAAPPDAAPLGEPSRPASPGATQAHDGPAWIEAPDGRCPESHPVKAKLTSGIYHLPGMTNYQRTKPDRCYRTAEDAEADGLRAAKR